MRSTMRHDAAPPRGEGIDMPIVWTGPADKYDHPELAVPCGCCMAYVGQPCDTSTFPLYRGHKAHQQRVNLAEALGFVDATRNNYLRARGALEKVAALVVPDQPRPATPLASPPADTGGTLFDLLAT